MVGVRRSRARHIFDSDSLVHRRERKKTEIFTFDDDGPAERDATASEDDHSTARKSHHHKRASASTVKTVQPPASIPVAQGAPIPATQGAPIPVAQGAPTWLPASFPVAQGAPTWPPLASIAVSQRKVDAAGRSDWSPEDNQAVLDAMRLFPEGDPRFLSAMERYTAIAEFVTYRTGFKRLPEKIAKHISHMRTRLSVPVTLSYSPPMIAAILGGRVSWSPASQQVSAAVPASQPAWAFQAPMATAAAASAATARGDARARERVDAAGAVNAGGKSEGEALMSARRTELVLGARLEAERLQFEGREGQSFAHHHAGGKMEPRAKSLVSINLGKVTTGSSNHGKRPTTATAKSTGGASASNAATRPVRGTPPLQKKLPGHPSSAKFGPVPIPYSHPYGERDQLQQQPFAGYFPFLHAAMQG